MATGTDFKSAMGWLSLIIMTAAYSRYIWITARSKPAVQSEENKPAPLSWLMWGIATAVVWAVQEHEQAGPGRWVVGFTAIICAFIGTYSLIKFHPWHFSLFDWVSIILGLSALVCFFISKSPRTSAIWATVADVLGYWPTIRKGWHEPQQDDPTSFALNSAKFIPSIFALQKVSLTTSVYPVTLVFFNAAMATMLIVRRRYLARSLIKPAILES